MDNRVTIIKLGEVIVRTGLSRSSIYRKINEHLFPSPVSLGHKAVGWVDGEIRQWIEERIAERDRQA
ncbi:AlpA family phage regulatory protein [Neptunomonas qingdaonensis]|uniref:Transcriptional regulator, AlpA family n=1 Tax=Neptunomonas qingdaonensis TaxID=1045558 RepID=A0A1I2QDE5_9GAMM|nr:AlpA family transcriptional regulator [Neptunomonas qingdaonensis]SFG24287.1 transcriptional regulator, AlpA family [Neptunomonas qingdaonensis]